MLEGPAVPTAGASYDEKAKYTKAIANLRKDAMAKPVDYWIYYLDYRTGESRSAQDAPGDAADTTEETTYDIFQVDQEDQPKDRADKIVSEHLALDR